MWIKASSKGFPNVLSSFHPLEIRGDLYDSRQSLHTSSQQLSERLRFPAGKAGVAYPDNYDH